MTSQIFDNLNKECLAFGKYGQSTNYNLLKTEVCKQFENRIYTPTSGGIRTIKERYSWDTDSIWDLLVKSFLVSDSKFGIQYVFESNSNSNRGFDSDLKVKNEDLYTPLQWNGSFGVHLLVEIFGKCQSCENMQCVYWPWPILTPRDSCTKAFWN